MGSQREFDREKMYRKIMPTYYETDPEEIIKKSSEDDSLQANTEKAQEAVPEKEIQLTNGSLLENKEIKWLQDRDKKAILYNITENLVLSKLDMVMGGMNCCKCDRCKMDIIALALNSLPPLYVVGTKNHLDMKIASNALGQKVTSAVLKAALTVRKQARH